MNFFEFATQHPWWALIYLCIFTALFLSALETFIRIITRK